ncbi:MAG: BA14K family protein [Pseudaminobacter sp.]
MKTLLSSFACSGLVALGVLAGLSTPATAGPLTGPITGVSDISPTLPVQKTGSGEWDPSCGIGRECAVGSSRAIAHRDFRRVDRREIRRNWDGRRWDGRRHWRADNWSPRRHYRPRYYRDPGVYLGFGWGVPSYRYIEPGYRYVRPRYVAPRYNRVRMSQAHVNWCYNRYRSYRAYDNTFQPYNGPRRQCYSPYS